jgi:hypothetical protein
MAGKRLYDITKSSIYEEGFNATDSFVITNKSDDKRILIYDFIKALRDGGYSGLGDGLEEEISFVTPDTIEAIKTPYNGKYKIEDGQIYLKNKDNSNWYTIAIGNLNGDTIKWTSKDNNYNTVSVDDSGVIKYPNNFIQANKNMTIDGDSTGLVMVDDDGVITKPKNFVSANIQNHKFPHIILNAPDENDKNHQVMLKCRIINGVPQFYGEIINE